ncbi:hypothetical protein BDF14DRAFT_1987403 [Spinellus fusiger]|nr:hypothetical protein BDF14DRAFT_1987403 [Spinellus fusiger]
MEIGMGNSVDEKGGPEPTGSIVETIATHSECLNTATSGGSSLACRILIEKVKR